MKSNAQKGQYYKARTKKWLEGLGYQVAHLERVMWIHTKDRMVPVKQDQFASDLMAMTGTDLVFVQVKLGRKSLKSARDEFQKFTFPPFAKRWIVIWELRKRVPDVVMVGVDNSVDSVV